MTDPQVDDSGTPPRKRIAVACGRCRKRKIRCSGDPGHGMPCSNCKNAGAEPCLFLRVSSTEAPLLRNDGDYGYNLDAGRALAHRGPVSHINSSMPHYQEVPNMSPGEVLTPYRGGQPYPYSGKQYYPVAGWTGAYPDDGVDFSMNCPSYPMLNNDPVHMVPYQTWGSRSKSAGSGSMYVDPDQGYPYSNTTNLVHRPAVTSDSANFSFSSVAASLPSAGPERLLPNPISRTLNSSSSSNSYRGESLPPYASSVKSSGTVGSTQTSPTSPMSDATTTGYGSSFDSTSLAAYPTAETSLPSQQGRGSHSTPDPYSSTGERIFAPEERLNVGSQGSAVDITGYTYSGSGGGSIRRASAANGLPSRTTSGDLPNGQAYMPSEGAPESAHHAHHHHHHQHHHHHHGAPVAGSTASVGYVGDVPGSSGSGGASGGGGTTTDTRSAAVTRR